MAVARVGAAGLLLAGLLTGCGGAPVAASPAPYVARDAGFKAVFGGTPKRSVKTVQNADGSVDFTFFQVTSGSEGLGVSYAQGARTLSGDDLQKGLDAAVNSEAAGVSGTVTTRSNLTFLGQPAEDALIKAASGTIVRTRVLFMGSRFYAMYGTAPSAAAPHPGYDRLVATFQTTA